MCNDRRFGTTKSRLACSYARFWIGKLGLQRHQLMSHLSGMRALHGLPCKAGS